MKTVKLTLMFLACSAAISSFAQTSSPQCGATNFDPNRNVYTVMHPAEGAVNQQCFITVYPKGAVPDQAQNYPASYLVEGRYAIDLSGGGGGGAGGTTKNKGGGGGAGAAPSQTVKYLAPGIYKMTIGTGGSGGRANGGQTESGNPTSLTNASNGMLIAGFPGADTWQQHIQQAKGAGHGAPAQAGGSSGGSGGDSKHSTEQTAESGGTLQTPGYSGAPGQAGNERAGSAQANAGGGGGASVGSGGSGGSGESANRNSVAGSGDLGGGGGGGRGGKKTADAGGQGGHGFLRLTMIEPEPQAVAPAPQVVVVETKTVIQKYSISSDTLFSFGNFTLKPEGNAKLDELAGKLKNVSVERITVTGHTDRIGSEESNQKLSENRAESVKAYLVNAGVQPERITVVGMGESQPVTSSDSCQGKTTPKVISCLQPDRRVEIEVAATQVAM